MLTALLVPTGKWHPPLPVLLLLGTVVVLTLPSLMITTTSPAWGSFRVAPKVADVTQLVVEDLPSMHNLELDPQHYVVIMEHFHT